MFLVLCISDRFKGHSVLSRPPDLLLLIGILVLSGTFWYLLGLLCAFRCFLVLLGAFWYFLVLLDIFQYLHRVE